MAVELQVGARATTLLYFVTVHEPYWDDRESRTVNCTLVDARTLLHPRVPQPHGGNIFRCVTEAPERVPGGIVPMSTVTYELDGGRLWPYVADWEAVSAAVVSLTQVGACDSLRMTLGGREHSLMSGGPLTTHHLHYADGGTEVVGARERSELLANLAAHVARLADQEAPLWPGNGLTVPSSSPARMPYQPFR